MAKSVLPDREVDRLIYIVDDGVKERSGHWYTLGIPVNHRYSRKEKLGTIEQLGESGSNSALGYLKSLIHEDVKYEGGRAFRSIYHREIHTYPNAPAYLRRMLDYGEEYTNDANDGEESEHVTSSYTKRDSVLSVINEAIARLESDIDASKTGE